MCRNCVMLMGNFSWNLFMVLPIAALVFADKNWLAMKTGYLTCFWLVCRCGSYIHTSWHTQCHLRLFLFAAPIRLNAINYPILGTPANNTLKKKVTVCSSGQYLQVVSEFIVNNNVTQELYVIDIYTHVVNLGLPRFILFTTTRDIWVIPEQQLK